MRVVHPAPPESDEALPPPHSDEAEQAVLGGLLIDNAARSKIESTIDVADFYSASHREIFAAFEELRARGCAVDLVTIAEALKARGRLDHVGGLAYLGTLVENVPTAANIAYHARIVREKSRLRQLAAAGNDFARAALSPSAIDAATLIEDAREKIDALALGHTYEGRLRFLTVPQLLATRGAQWRIVRVIPGRGVIVIYGAPGTGKTFLVFDLVAAIARGRAWFGHRVKRGAVVYLAAEGHLRHRLMAYLEHAPDADLSLLRVLHATLDLRDPTADLPPLLAQLRTLERELGGVAAVVVDTLNSVMPGGAENLPEDMGAVLASARKIAEALRCVVCLIHHSGKNLALGPRGSSTLPAAVDTQILVTEDGDLRTAEIEKQRDGEKGERFCFRLVPYSWPSEDPDAEPGELEGSCAIAPALDGEATRPAKSKRRDIALDALREAIGEHGEPLPETSTIPPGTKAVRLECWAAQWRLRTGDDYGNPKTAEAAFRRERQKLLKAGSVVISNPFAWIA